jgi:hypothetical protein
MHSSPNSSLTWIKVARRLLFRRGPIQMAEPWPFHVTNDDFDWLGANNSAAL